MQGLSCFTSYVYNNQWLAFKRVVLSCPKEFDSKLVYASIPQDLYVASLQFIEYVVRLVCGGLYAARQKSYNLQTLAGEEIDVSHLRSLQGRCIDMSGVPHSVKLESVLTLFNEIKFTEVPRYKELPLDVQKLPLKTQVSTIRGYLERFVKNVGARVAKTGAPCETAEREQFYRTVEDATRFSLHHLKDPESKQLWLLDLAFSEIDCATAYMNVATHWQRLCAGQELCESFTLQNELCVLLAHERGRVAEKEAATFSAHVEKEQQPHHMMHYLQTLGPILELPGTAGIIEHLKKEEEFPVREQLALFFKNYTVNRIIDAVSDRYQSSQTFRAKVVEWVGSHCECTSDCTSLVEAIIKTPDKEKPEKIFAATHGFIDVEQAQQLVTNQALIEPAVQGADKRRQQDAFVRQELGDRGAPLPCIWMEKLLVDHQILFPQGRTT